MTSFSIHVAKFCQKVHASGYILAVRKCVAKEENLLNLILRETSPLEEVVGAKLHSNHAIQSLANVHSCFELSSGGDIACYL